MTTPGTSRPECRTRREIAARMGISMPTLSRWITDAEKRGIKIKPAHVEAHHGYNVYLYDLDTVAQIEALKKGHHPRGQWPRGEKRGKA